MKLFTIIASLFLITSASCFAQVGINTETPDASSALHIDSTTGGLLPPRMTELQRDAITDPANGLIIYNTEINSLEINTGTTAIPVWSILTASNNIKAKTITLYRDLSTGSNNIEGTNDTFFNFPLGASQVTEINSDVFTVLGDGQIRVEETGSYLISASLAVEDLSAGSRKYILAVFRGSTRLGYLARGFVNIPGPAANTEFFGGSGAFQFRFTAGDVINIRYVLNNDGAKLDGNLLHIGILKL